MLRLVDPDPGTCSCTHFLSQLQFLKVSVRRDSFGFLVMYDLAAVRLRPDTKKLSEEENKGKFSIFSWGKRLQSCDGVTWTSLIFVPLQVADDSLGCVTIGPPIRDGRPQLWMPGYELGLIGQDDLVTGLPQTPQAQIRFLWRGGVQSATPIFQSVLYLYEGVADLPWTQL